MVRVMPPQGKRDLRAWLEPLFEMAEHSPDLIASFAGSFRHEGKRFGIPRFVWVGPRAEHDPIKVGLFAGIHGDESAGPEALLQLLLDLVEEPDLALGYDLVVYPICNPTGWERHSRPNAAGADLNREFWRSSPHPEVRILESELRSLGLNGLVHLHADDSSEGIYGYAHGRLLNEELLRPALRACEGILPRDARASIDGFSATESVLRDCYPGVLSAPPEQDPAPFDIIFETPGLAPLEAQVGAAVAALKSVLHEYRRFMAFGQDL